MSLDIIRGIFFLYSSWGLVEMLVEEVYFRGLIDVISFRIGFERIFRFFRGKGRVGGEEMGI